MGQAGGAYAGAYATGDFDQSMGPASDPTAIAAIVCYFCCWCSGVVAIMKARQVTQFNAIGDYKTAHEARRDAMNWTYITLVFGIIIHAVRFFTGGSEE